MLEELFTYPFMIKILNKILNDNDKILIISLNKFFNDKRLKFIYNKQVNIRLYNDDQFYKLSDKEQLKILKSKNFKSKRIEFLKHEWFYNCLTNVLVDYLYKLPYSITRLTFGFNFNQSIENIIPDSVIWLTFGFCFNQSIQRSVPNSVKYLEFGYHFNQPIFGSIPNSVKYLTFGCEFDLCIENCLPNSVTHLKFNNISSYENLKYIPDSVNHLVIRYISECPTQIMDLLLDKFFIKETCSVEVYFLRK